MNEQPKMAIDDSTGRAHWFNNPFYRKDGRKRALDLAKLGRISIGLFVVGYAVFFVQADPSLEPGSVSRLRLGSVVPGMGKEIELPQAPNRRTIQNKKSSGTVVEHRRGKLYSPPEVVLRQRVPIPAGSVVRARLVTGASNGPVKAEVIEPFIVNGALLLEAGLVFFGTGSSSDERLQVHFTRLMFSDGEAQVVSAEALDPDDKTAGLRGSTLGNRTAKITGSIGLNFASGIAEGLQELETKNGTAFRAATLKNSFLNGVSAAAVEESHELLSSLKNSRPVFYIEAGKEILIFFSGE